MSPSGKTNYAQGSGAADSAERYLPIAWLINKGLGTMYPIVEGGRYDSIADKVLHLCETGDGVCDAVTGNVLSGHIHSYAYRSKDVFSSDPNDPESDAAKFKKIFTDRDPDISAENRWQSDWSIWQDSRVRDWLGERA